VAAIRKTAEGPVVYSSDRCIGCRYCMLACPANVPRYEWHNPVPAVRKCDLCAERLQRGEIPACAEVCPAGATVFGTRAEMLEEAHRRIAENPGQYYPHVFGEKELGGTSVLALSPVSFSSLGFPADLGDLPLPDLTWHALQKVPVVAIVGGAALFAIYWITHRREMLMNGEQAAEAKSGETRAGEGKPGEEEIEEERGEEGGGHETH
jgi:formate dehydrogenase iron-sulfur subunit